MKRGIEREKVSLEARVSDIILNLTGSRLLSHEMMSQLSKGNYALAACAAFLDTGSAIMTRYDYKALIRRYTLFSRNGHSRA